MDQFWSGHDLARFLGHKPASWHKFEGALYPWSLAMPSATSRRDVGACENGGTAVTAYFYGVTNWAKTPRGQGDHLNTTR
jgi:hypothetical protein